MFEKVGVFFVVCIKICFEINEREEFWKTAVVGPYNCCLVVALVGLFFEALREIFNSTHT